MSEQTRCDLFGHQYHLWKEGGKSYMRCEYCPAVRHIFPEDFAPEPRKPTLEQEEKWIWQHWDGLLRKLAQPQEQER